MDRIEASYKRKVKHKRKMEMILYTTTYGIVAITFIAIGLLLVISGAGMIMYLLGIK